MILRTTRRGFLAAAIAAAALPRAATARDRSVVLYSSVDDYLLRDFVRACESEIGLRVRVVGDTEATKTTGLVTRLLAERASPRADVWWSSEPIGTVRLARHGVLEPATTRAEADFAGSWPAGLRAGDRAWYGFAPRARVIVFSADRVRPADAPRRLRELLAPRWAGRVGMARPQFGTTRTHMTALLHLSGDDALRAWLSALKDARLRLYDGNAAVVRAVAFGEIDAGLTDTDDVHAGRRQGWPIEFAFEVPDDERPERGLPSFGPVALPNTVALVRGGPNPGAGRELLDFILSERVERMLAASDSRNAPIRDAVRRDCPSLALPPGPALDWERVADRVEPAMELCNEVLG